MVNFPSCRFKTSGRVKSFLVSGAVSISVSAMLAGTASAQSSAEAEYSAVLQGISDAKVSLMRQELFVARQGTKISTLDAQIKGVDDWKLSIAPMVEKMTAGIAREIRGDYPFELDRRMPRLQSLEGTVKDPAAAIGDKYRKALNAYKIEVNYGQSMEAKKGDHPISPTIREGDDRYEKDKDGKLVLDKKTNLPKEIFDGNYLRYGRLAYVYLQGDNSQALRFDLATKKWVELPKNKIADIRRGVRIASGEAAPNVVRAPVISPSP